MQECYRSFRSLAGKQSKPTFYSATFSGMLQALGLNKFSSSTCQLAYKCFKQTDLKFFGNILATRLSILSQDLELHCKNGQMSEASFCSLVLWVIGMFHPFRLGIETSCRTSCLLILLYGTRPCFKKPNLKFHEMLSISTSLFHVSPVVLVTDVRSNMVCSFTTQTKDINFRTCYLSNQPSLCCRTVYSRKRMRLIQSSTRSCWASRIENTS